MVKSRIDIARRFESDARAIVPVNDAIGGTVIYVRGRLAYYVLNGECFPALPEPDAGLSPALSRGPSPITRTPQEAAPDGSTS